MSYPATNEKVPFKLIQTPCCHTLLCWVNPRLPNHCPECGRMIYMTLRISPEHILQTRDGWLRLEEVK